MESLLIPELDDILMNEHVQEYPFAKTFGEAQHDPFVSLHTSGSTGLPKLVVPTHGTFTCSDTFQELPALGYPSIMVEALRGKRVFIGLPPFHSAGLFCMLAMPTYFDVTPVLGPLLPLTADIVNQIHLLGDIKVSTIPPAIVEDIVNEPQYLETLGKLDYVMYGGGQLSKDAGDMVIQKTSILSLMGSTETMLLPTEIPSKDDWQYYNFSPCIGTDFRHYWDDLYEMVIVRKPEWALSQSVFYTFPDMQEYSLKDVYSPHPTKAGLWLYRGRSDDVIVFSTGEKINPILMEGIIGIHPRVSSVLVVGQGRFQSALLVEPKTSLTKPEEKGELLEDIWPSIERANKDCPAHGRIMKDFVLFTSPDKPMSRAGKGTVQRMTTVALYKPELDDLYASGNSEIKRLSKNLMSLNSEKSFCRTLKPIIAKQIDTADFINEDDLFALGLDSLKAMNLVKDINCSLETVGRGDLRIQPRTVYAKPTVSQLASSIMAKKDTEAEAILERNQLDREQRMKNVFDHYIRDLPISGRKPIATQLDARKVVILTGSTGSIGSYVLDSLLSNTAITHIYCFTRSHPIQASTHQQQINEAKGLTTSFPTSRVTFLTVDLTKTYFGLPKPTYRTLLHRVTHILHNAWEVNFNLALQSFHPQIKGVRSFVDFSVHSTYAAFIFFISTISAVANWPIKHSSNMPEEIVDDWSLPQATGYAESKYISERLLDEAVRISNVPSAICRVGQVAGPTSRQGVWRVGEWFPSLIKTSVGLSALPSSLGPLQMVDWIPVDRLAGCIRELFLDNGGSVADGDDSKRMALGSSVYHLVNPTQTTYDLLLPSIIARFSSTPRLLPFADWVDLVTTSDLDAESHPAVKLLDFFKGLAEMDKEGKEIVVLETRLSREKSELLREQESVKGEWMERWMRQWGY